MGSQQDTPLDLFVDGYISHTFGPRDVEVYQSSLLNRGRGDIQWDVDDTGAFLATPPPGLATDQHHWVLDHKIRYAGPVIRQKLWAPKKEPDRQRWVEHAVDQLHRPIFFIKQGGGLGLPLTQAADGDCKCLQGAEGAAPVGSGAHAQIRVNVSSISTFVVRI